MRGTVARWEMMLVPATRLGNGDTDTIRLVLVDDHDLVVLAMTAAFAEVAGIDLVGTATSMADGEALVARHRPDVVLLDRRLPDGDGIDAIGRFLAAVPNLRVLLFTGSADRAIADRVAAEGGAGLLLKAGRVEDLVATIRGVAAGGTAFDVDLPGGRRPR